MALATSRQECTDRNPLYQCCGDVKVRGGANGQAWPSWKEFPYHAKCCRCQRVSGLRNGDDERNYPRHIFLGKLNLSNERWQEGAIAKAEAK